MPRWSECLYNREIPLGSELHFTFIQGILTTDSAISRRGRGGKMAVVVSAMGGKPKVTDLLLKCVTLAAAGDLGGSEVKYNRMDVLPRYCAQRVTGYEPRTMRMCYTHTTPHAVMPR